MADDDTIPPDLRTVLDGYDIGRGFGRTCPGCGHEHEPGDRLVVTTARTSASKGWDVPSVVCSDCGQRSFSENDRRSNLDQVLVSISLAPAPMALVLDGETARLLDRSPATGG